MLDNFLGYFEKNGIFQENSNIVILGQLLTKLGYFYSSIWSHWYRATGVVGAALIICPAEN